MNNAFLTAALLVCCTATLFSQTIFVKEGSQGDGSSWERAYGDLQQALAQADSGQEIWVAEGDYLPTSCYYCDPAQRDIAFEIPAGVRLYGGFSGNETSLSHRRWYAHPTKLSGEIGEQTRTDNSYSVVSLRNSGDEVLLDGFVITGGQADSWEARSVRRRSGGGLFNDGAGAGRRSNPLLKNCVFLDNYAEEGAAVFNDSHDGGEASPRFENCTFVSNVAAKGGGGIFSNQEKGAGKLNLKKCKFVNNYAGFGAAVFIAQHGGSGENDITSCQFVNNKATAGSAFFSLGMDELLEPAFFLCNFLNNSNTIGDDAYHCEGRQIPKNLMDSLVLNGEEKL